MARPVAAHDRRRITAAPVDSPYKRVQAGDKSLNTILWKWEGKYAAPFYRQSSVFMVGRGFHFTTHHVHAIHLSLRMHTRKKKMNK